MTIARRANGHSERAPQCLVRPEDRARQTRDDLESGFTIPQEKQN